MAKKKPVQKAAIDYNETVKSLKQSDPNIDSVAIVEEKDKLVFSTSTMAIVQKF